MKKTKKNLQAMSENNYCPHCGGKICLCEDDFEDDEDYYYDEDEEKERQEEEQVQMALSCTCGAWQISEKTGLAIHVADCICGHGD